MKQILMIALLPLVAALLFIVDVRVPPESPSPSMQLVSEAHAILGVRRRAVRRGVVIGASAGAAQASAATASQQQAATAQQQSATAQQQSATAQQQAATAQQQSATAQQQAGALPIGTVAATLPAGCTAKQVGGVEYQHCGANYYRAAFQGNNLVYVVSKP
jgi:glucose/arabinose dehydrogenase